MMRILNTDIVVVGFALSELDISMHESNVCILNNKCYYFKKYVSD